MLTSSVTSISSVQDPERNYCRSCGRYFASFIDYLLDPLHLCFSDIERLQNQFVVTQQQTILGRS